MKIVRFAVCCVLFSAVLLPAVARAATYTQWLDHMAGSIHTGTSLLGLSSRAFTVNAINSMKQGEKEAALESLQQAITTMAVLDVGALTVQNPFTALLANHIATRRQFSNVYLSLMAYSNALRDGSFPAVKNQAKLLSDVAKYKADAIQEFNSVVSKLPDTDETVKYLNKAARWAKVGKVLDAFGAMFDAVAIGVNAWALDSARKAGSVPSMVSASLGISAGIVGVTTFIYALAAKSAIAGPVGAIVGALLGLCATLTDIFGSNPSSNMQTTIKQLQQLTKAGQAELSSTSVYVQPLGKHYGKVYESNPANMLDLAGMPPAPLQFKLPGHPLSSPAGLLGAGMYRMVDLKAWSNPYWTVSGSEPVGYDFYGKEVFKEAKGVTVFVDTKLVRTSGAALKGAYIQTYSDGSANYFLEDHVSITDFGNLKAGQTIVVRTGSGNDVISINGRVGKFTSSFANVLDVDAGSAINELTFGSISKLNTLIKGVYFNRVNNRVGFYHGSNRQKHEFGSVRGITVVHGSPFDDFIMIHGNGFRAENTRGKNIYEIDMTHASSDHGGIKHAIVDNSNDRAKIRVTSNGDIKIENFSYYNKLLTISWRDKSGSWHKLREVTVACHLEPEIQIITNGRRTATFLASWARKVQINGQRYTFNFHQDITGTSKNDMVRMYHPDSGAKSQHTIDLGDGEDVVVITSDLMGYGILSGKNTLHLIFNGREFELKIRGQNFYFHDVVLRNVEFILNEKLETLVDVKAAQSNDIDLGALYKLAVA